MQGEWVKKIQPSFENPALLVALFVCYVLACHPQNLQLTLISRWKDGKTVISCNVHTSYQPHHSEKNYYVNFSGGLDSNEFQLK